VWLITLRDLQWRKRRFAIAVVGAGLVFALTLVIAGMSASFRDEAARTVAAVGADAWVVRAGTAGPFTTLATLPAALAGEIAKEPGVRAADPIVVIHQTIRAPRDRDINLFGHRIGGLGAPPVKVGRPVAASGEAVVDSTLGLHPGSRFGLGPGTFTVAGTTAGMSFNAGIPTVYVSIQDVQVLVFGGRPVAGAIVTRGVPASVPAGYAMMGNAGARADLLRPVAKAVGSIDIFQLLLWIVAALIVGSVVYVSALERVRDFAVLKATGSSSRGLLAGLALQAVILSLAGALVAILLAVALTPLFPIKVEVPVRAVVLLPGIAIGVGLLASLAGVRRAVGVDPAVAFGGP